MAKIGYIRFLSGQNWAPLCFSDRNDPRMPCHWPTQAATRRWPRFRGVHPIVATQLKEHRLGNQSKGCIIYIMRVIPYLGRNTKNVSCRYQILNGHYIPDQSDIPVKYARRHTSWDDFSSRVFSTPDNEVTEQLKKNRGVWKDLIEILYILLWEASLRRLFRIFLPSYRDNQLGDNTSSEGVCVRSRVLHGMLAVRIVYPVTKESYQVRCCGAYIPLWS